MIRFFEPNRVFLHWLSQYVGKRIVFDIGCGDGHIVKALNGLDVRAVGIDPRYSYERMPQGMMSLILPMAALECSFLGPESALHPDGVLALFCRPCHNGFVKEAVEWMHPGIDVLYISKPSMLKIDLPGVATLPLVTPPCPEEKVYRVIRRSAR